MQEKQITFQNLHNNPKTAIENIKNNRTPITILCDHMTDPRNVGSLFRLADAARLEELLFLSDPTFEITPKINKISRQTIQYVPHRILHDTAALSDDYFD